MKRILLKIDEFFEKKFINNKKINGLFLYIFFTEIIKMITIPVITESELNIYQSILLMTLISITIKLITLDIYDLKEGDWFWIEKYKFNRNIIIENPNKFIKLIIFFSKIGGNILLFISFSIIDPLILVLIFRKGNHQWNGLTWWFKILFLISNMVSAIPLYYGIKIIIKVVKEIIIIIF